MREGVENSLGEESRDAAGEGRVAESSAPALMFFFFAARVMPMHLTL
jgi:hypothetical protein